MRFSLPHVCSVLCVCASSFALISPTQLLAAEATKNVYPAEVVKTFMKGCQFKNKKPFCSCIINSIQTKYTFAEFKKIDEDAREKRQIPDAIQSIVDSCNQKK
jgi:hypothetical protein